MEKFNDGDVGDGDENFWIKLIGLGLLLFGAGTIASMIYLAYKVATGVYHLLDKLIDKI